MTESPATIAMIYNPKLATVVVHKLLTSVTLKVGQGDAHTIPRRFFFHERYLHTKFGDPRSVCSNILSGKHFYDEYTNLTSVTLKVGQGEPHTISSSFSMRDTYTPKLVIPGQLTCSQHIERKSNTQTFDLCDLESRSRWPRYNTKQHFQARYLHTKLVILHVCRFVPNILCGKQIIPDRRTYMHAPTHWRTQGQTAFLYPPTHPVWWGIIIYMYRLIHQLYENIFHFLIWIQQNQLDYM